MSGLCLVLRPDFTVLDVTDAYLCRTGRRRREVVERPVFELVAEGVALELRDSLERVLAKGAADAMPIRRYDIRAHAEPGGPEERYWCATSRPTLDPRTGAVSFVLHELEDVTDLVLLREARLRSQGWDTPPRARGRISDEPFQASVQLRASTYDTRRGEAEREELIQHLRRERGRLHELTVDLERRVENRTGQLARSVAELEAFSYSVSHDLRAPLRVIAGYAGLIGEEPRVPERVRMLATRIEAAAGRMNGLIDDLLALSRASRDTLDVQSVDLAALAREVAEELRRRFPDRSVAFAAPPRALAEADPRFLRIVLENLLGNAWKFPARTPSARVEFGVTAGGPSPTFYVRDNGVGFDPIRAVRLFEPFVRLHGAAEFEGTGIGLAIVHRVITRHGGRVWAEAAPGQGATFSFTLAATHPPEEERPLG